MIGRWVAFFQTHLLPLYYHLPLAALISLDTLRNALSTLGYPAVTLFIMVESSGIPFPGETMLLLASFYAALDHRLQIPVVIACAALGAIVGDNIGYLVGRTGGYALVQRFGRYVFLKPAHLEKARRFFAKHGDKTVFWGRFVAVLRAWAAFLAGVNHMRWSLFLLYNAAGGILWSIVYGCLGFYAGRVFHDNFGAVEQIASTISWSGAVLIVGVALVVILVVRFRRKRQMVVLVEVELHLKPEENASDIALAQSVDTASAEAQEEALPLPDVENHGQIEPPIKPAPDSIQQTPDAEPN